MSYTSPRPSLVEKPSKGLGIVRLSCVFLLQAQYSDVLFLCEGWPLCLHDRVVIHFAPIDPSLLQPGDFYLRVAPFCDQSARILVCSLLEEEGLLLEVVEETPIPETSYPCIFSCDWLEEINQGRHGTPLRRCLLAAEQGLVRLPWELVAVPDFVDESTCAGTSMASSSPLCPPFPPSLPQPAAPLRFLENSSSSHAVVLSSARKPREQQHPVTIQNSILAPSSNSCSAFSVETRICPAKHGIAVSLCLVDTKASRSVRLKEIETEPKPVGLVSPSKWDSCSTGTNTARKTNTVSGTSSHAAVDAHGNRCEDKGAENTQAAENTQEDKNRVIKDISRSGPAGHTALQGEYIDILQAAMLFSSSQSVLEEQQKSEMQKHMQSGPPMQRYPPRPTQTQPLAQMEARRQPNGAASPHTQLPELPAQSHCRAEGNLSLGPDISEPGPQSASKHSQPAQPESLSSSQCVRTLCFSEKPCTPCMRRRQHGKVSKAQDLRCRYRDSYQAAIQNPVAFEEERKKRNMLAVVEEGGNLSQCDVNVPDCADECEGPSFNPPTQHQSRPTATEVICEESGEKSTVPYWKPDDTNTRPRVEYNVFKSDRLPEQKSQKETYGIFPNMNGSTMPSGTGLNPDGEFSCSNDPQQQQMISAKHHRALLRSGEVSRMNVNLAGAGSTGVDPNCPRALSVPQSRRDSVSDGRCSSLSTAVVDISEKCELVLVEGQNIRRRENAEPCAEIPQLHVVKCKNSTAFRLVSPKISRRTTVAPGVERAICRTCWVQVNAIQLSNICFLQLVLTMAAHQFPTTRHKTCHSVLHPRHREAGSLPPHTPDLTTFPWDPQTPEPTLCI